MSDTGSQPVTMDQIQFLMKGLQDAFLQELKNQKEELQAQIETKLASKRSSPTVTPRLGLGFQASEIPPPRVPPLVLPDTRAPPPSPVSATATSASTIEATLRTSAENALRTPAPVATRLPFTMPPGGSSMYGFGDIYGPEETLDNYELETENPLRANKSNRRDTIFENKAQQAETGANRMNYQAIQPSYTHIYLDKLSIRSIKVFYESSVSYQFSCKIKINLVAQIKQNIIHKIIAHFPALDGGKIYNLPDKELFRTLCFFVTPQTKATFLKKMEHCVQFQVAANYKPTAEQFGTFYDALLQYRQDYTKVYEILSVYDKTCVPEVKNKEGGLIRLFLNKIPYEYGTNLFIDLPQKKYDKIYDFLRDFYARVKEDHAYYLHAYRLGQRFGGTAYVAKKIEHRLQALHDADPQVPDSRPANPLADMSDNDDSEGEDQDFVDQLAVLTQPYAKDKPKDKAFSPDQLPCLKMTLEGVCLKPAGTCKYSHSAALITRERAAMMDKLKRQMQPSQANAPRKFSNMQVPPDPPEDDEDSDA